MNCCKSERSKKHFISRLPSYDFWSILIRFTLVSIVGLISMQFIKQIIGLPVNHSPRTVDYIMVIIGFNLLSEVNIVIDILFEKIMPIPEKIKLRIFVHSVVGLLLIISFFYGMKAFVPYKEGLNKNVFLLAIALGLLFVNSFSARLILARFLDKWVYVQQSIDELKQEKLKQDYSSLQDQLNPHFLFNNLSVLKSLIMYDKETALNFTQNFTDVYRYVLKSQHQVLINLTDEIEFIDAYIALHKERLGDGLEVSLSLDKELIDYKMAPLTLQLLIENAIKHNIVSKETPLHIQITSDEQYLTVSNNIQLKEASYSTKTGLKNLIKRYELIGGLKIIIEQDEYNFGVKVPLIDKDKKVLS